MDSLNIRLSQAEERINLLEGGAQRKRKKEKVKKTYGTHRIPSKEQYMHYENARKKRKRKGQKAFVKQ